MPEINCIRRATIADPAYPYRQERHTCFICGVEWEPDPSLACTVCNWLRYPRCGECRCRVSEYDKAQGWTKCAPPSARASDRWLW